MAICEMHLGSGTALQKMTAFTAIVPEHAPGPWATLYLLHGLSDDHTAWTRRTSLERFVEGLPLLVVMPNGERGWYTDSVSNPMQAFETYLTQDLIGFVDSTFHTCPVRDARAVAGLSMGGYGAIKLALKYPNLFCAGVSHSGALEIAARSWEEDNTRQAELRAIFGANPQDGDNDTYALAQRADTGARPALRIDCGVDDFLIEDNRRFHAHLEQIGYSHEYVENAGRHDWAYWNFHILDTLKFVGQEFGCEFRPEDHLYPGEVDG